MGETCYESNARPRRYASICERKYSWGTAKEDYVLPEAHTVAVRIAPEQLAGVSGDCFWAWQPRKAGGKERDAARTVRGQAHHRARALRVRSRQFRRLGHRQAARRPRAAEREVVVEDLFIVALGDSFASGESNPDRPVQFSAEREMVYDPTLLREDVAARGPAKGAAPGFGLASSDEQYNPKVLPRRLMGDEPPGASTSSSRPNSPPRSRRHRRNGSAATAIARNTAIRSAWRSSSRSRTAIARSRWRASPARARR